MTAGVHHTKSAPALHPRPHHARGSSSAAADGATSAGFFSPAHPGFEGTSVFCFDARGPCGAKRCLTQGPGRWEPAMQFAWQTLDGAMKPMTDAPGRNGGRGQNCFCQMFWGPAFWVLGWRHNSCQHPCGMLAPVRQHPVPGSFGRIPGTGGFNPKRFSMVCFGGRWEGRAGSSDEALMTLHAAVSNPRASLHPGSAQIPAAGADPKARGGGRDAAPKQSPSTVRGTAPHRGAG